MRTRFSTPKLFVLFVELSQGSPPVRLAGNIESENRRIKIAVRRIARSPSRPQKAERITFVLGEALGSYCLVQTWEPLLVGSGRRLLSACERPKYAGRIGSQHILHQGASCAAAETLLRGALARAQIARAQFVVHGKDASRTAVLSCTGDDSCQRSSGQPEVRRATCGGSDAAGEEGHG